MHDQMEAHFKIWGTLAVTKVAAFGLEEYHMIASIFALICGAIASLSIAYWHIFKKRK